MSTITPPVALTAYAAAGIASADPIQVAWTAARLGVLGYIVPFMFVYSPSLLMLGTPLQIMVAVPTAALGVMDVAIGLEGYFVRR